MPTVVNLTDQELSELRSFTNESDDSAAVRSAMGEYLRFARRMQLKAASGQVSMDDNWRTLEDNELKGRNGS